MRSWREIPVLINNRDRLEYLSLLIGWIERIGMQRIFVIDNDSSYEPLLEYYERSPHTIIRSTANVGYLAAWELPIHREFLNDLYIYTDPDVLPVESCPVNVIEVFVEALGRYPDVDKVGFGLKIDDLPSDAPHSAEILAWERSAWQRRREELFFEAPIDTTFALYRAHARGGYWVPCLRSGLPYVARHLPWYRTPYDWTPEDIHYAAHAGPSTYWTRRSESLRGGLPPG